MFQPEITAVGEILWADKDGDTAKFSTRFPISLSLEDAFSSAMAIANAAMAISDAVPIRITLRYRSHDDDAQPAGPGSNVARILCLYYSNDVDTEPVFIPSGDLSLLETTGRFAGIRLDLSNPAVASLADALTTALAGSLDANGGEWGRVLVVGGITR